MARIDYHRTLSQKASQGDREARMEMASLAVGQAMPFVRALVRDNRLYELEDAHQQVWIFALEGVDKDRGVGDPIAFVVNFIKWRIKDWSSAKLRRHAFLVCQVCAHTQAIASVATRECKRCGAGTDRIDSVTFHDYGTDGSEQMGLGIDTSLPEVAEFLDSLDPRECTILAAHMAGRSRDSIASELGLSPSRVSQISSGLRLRYQRYLNAVCV